MSRLSCPGCENLFSPGPLTTPHILSCKHPLCSGCLEHSGVLQCPVIGCQSSIPSQTVDMFPVHHYLLGEALVTRNVDNESPESLNKVESSDYKICIGAQPPRSTERNIDKSQLDGTIEKARKLLVQLAKAKKHIDEEINSKQEEKANLTKVSSHFEKCHAQLDLDRRRVKEALKKAEERRLIREKDISMTNKLVDVLEMPVDCENAAQLVIDQNIFSALESHVKVEVANNTVEEVESPGQSSFIIIDSEESKTLLSEEIEITIIGSEDCKIIKYEESTFASCDVRLNENPSQEITPKPSPTTHPGVMVFEEMDRVEVTWINSPSSFFVMRIDDFPFLERMECEMEQIISEVSEPKEEVQEGDVVALEIEGLVVRAEVTIVVEGLATVFYIDEGGVGAHPLGQLHALPVHLTSVPGLAHHCSLARVASTGTEWSELATQTLAQATQDTHCILTVQDKAIPVTVDLFLEPAEGVSRDQKCCLASYLVYRGLASWVDGGVGVATRQIKTYRKGFVKLAPAREGSEHLVVVSHIEDPGYLFVQRIGEQGGYAQYIKTLVEEVEMTYMKRKGERGLQVLVPRVGIACVAQLSTNRMHYRAQVTAVLEEGRVEVQFVDFGNKETIEDCKVFKILDRFMTLPIMATPVCLAGIGSLEGRAWDKDAAHVLREMTIMKELVMFVNEERNGEELCKVMLYESLDDRDVCVNAWLVMEGQAVSLTGACSTLEYKKENSCRVETTGGEVSVRNAAGQSGVKKVEKVACRVVSIQSPASIFIRQVMDEANFYQLNTDLQSHYSYETSAAHVTPEAGGLCAVQTGHREGWARAKVITVKRGVVEVKLLDAGKNIEVSAESLRPLDVKFRFKNFVDEAHLVNLLPAGGKETWTKTACETLEEILEEFDMMVHVEMVGKAGKGTMPINMFLRVMDGAENHFVPVSEKLIQLGLAIPIDENKSGNAAFGDEEDSIPETMSLQDSATCFNPVSTPTDWLRPLPPPPSEFLAVPSHVDWEGNIFICPLIPNQDNIRIVGNVLDSKYQGSVHTPVDRYWTVGQACVARWDLDGRWYRAVVLGVNYDGHTVQFVDYGTVEVVTVEDMRKDLFMTEMPIQCFPLQLDHIHPVIEKWERSVLDFLHSTVVDQTLTAVITSTMKDVNNNTDNYVGKLTTRAGLDIGQLLVRNGYARVSDCVKGQ